MKNLSKKPSYYSFANHAKHHGMTSVVAPFRTMKECYNERFPFTHCTQLLSILIKLLLCVKATHTFLPHTLYILRSIQGSTQTPIHHIFVNISLIDMIGNNIDPKSNEMNGYLNSLKNKSHYQYIDFSSDLLNYSVHSIHPEVIHKSTVLGSCIQGFTKLLPRTLFNQLSIGIRLKEIRSYDKLICFYILINLLANYISILVLNMHWTN